MDIIKNFLPKNTNKKIYAVMSRDYFMQVTIDESSSSHSGGYPLR